MDEKVHWHLDYNEQKAVFCMLLVSRHFCSSLLVLLCLVYFIFCGRGFHYFIIDSLFRAFCFCVLFLLLSVHCDYLFVFYMACDFSLIHSACFGPLSPALCVFKSVCSIFPLHSTCLSAGILAIWCTGTQHS